MTSNDSSPSSDGTANVERFIKEQREHLAFLEYPTVEFRKDGRDVKADQIENTRNRIARLEAWLEQAKSGS